MAATPHPADAILSRSRRLALVDISENDNRQIVYFFTSFSFCVRAYLIL